MNRYPVVVKDSIGLKAGQKGKLVAGSDNEYEFKVETQLGNMTLRLNPAWWEVGHYKGYIEWREEPARAYINQCWSIGEDNMYTAIHFVSKECITDDQLKTMLAAVNGEVFTKEEMFDLSLHIAQKFNKRIMAISLVEWVEEWLNERKNEVDRKTS